MTRGPMGMDGWGYGGAVKDRQTDGNGYMEDGAGPTGLLLYRRREPSQPASVFFHILSSSRHIISCN